MGNTDSVSEKGKHVLIIDGAYAQIGLRDLNEAFQTKFRLSNSAKLLRFLHVLRAIFNQEIDRVIFVSAEDFDGMTKQESVYTRLGKSGVELDIREYKQKSYNCAKCKHRGVQRV